MMTRAYALNLDPVFKVSLWPACLRSYASRVQTMWRYVTWLHCGHVTGLLGPYELVDPRRYPLGVAANQRSRL
jgi:hypothetical protein